MDIDVLHVKEVRTYLVCIVLGRLEGLDSLVRLRRKAGVTDALV